MWAKHAHYVSKADQKLLFNECHVNRVYEQMGVRIGQKRGAAVIDVGANVGFFATRAAEALGNVEGCVVIAAEPLPPTFEALEYNINLHKEWCVRQNIACANIIALNVGVGDEQALPHQNFTLYPEAAGWGTLTSLEASEEQIMSDMDAFIDNALDGSVENALNPIQRSLGKALRRTTPTLYRTVARQYVKRMLSNKQITQCPMQTISDIIDEYVLPPQQQQQLHGIELLKIDVERAEVQVLQGILTQRHWDCIDQLSMEVHEENLPQIYALVKDRGGFQNITTTQTPDLARTSIHMVYCIK